MHEFIKYLVYWVAGTKMIFIVLLVVILLTGSPATKLLSVVALILSILSFYWRLYSIIRKLDKGGYINPQGYSRILGLMIVSFIMVFLLILIFSFVF